MPLPVPAPDTALLRFRIEYGGVPRPAFPLASSDLTLTRAPADNADAGAFYYRDKLSGGPLIFSGADFALLWAIERSTARCQPLGLLVEHRGSTALPWEQWRGSFTCNDCTDWNAATCTVKLTPESADAYQKFLDNFDKEYNILLDVVDKTGQKPRPRTTVTAQLALLAAGIKIEFMRVGASEQGDYLGTDGWTLFLQNTSWIPRSATSGFLDGLRETNNILFRYRLRSIAMTPVPRADGTAGYIPVDKSGSGWQVLQESYDPTAGTVDYVRAPAIAGFKAYKIGTYSNWNDPRNPAAVALYGDQLLLVDTATSPIDYGFPEGDYIEVTGPDGYGANSAECFGDSLRVRRDVKDEQCSRLFWRFGNFKFGRCFRLIDGLYSLLSQTVLPFGGAALLPPTAEQLSDFLTLPANPATGDTGLANEVPRLLLSAASDVKRYGASEAATRLLISLKQFLSDLAALYDGGWFVDPATGWVRFEHRAYLQSQRDAAGIAVDLRELEDVLLTNTYAYRTQQLPRYEDLTISSASTEDLPHAAYFAKASLDYGLSACINTKEGSNRVGLTVSRLTGDVTAGVLNGDQVPDSALFVLAPDNQGRLNNANRELAASSLLFRYYRRGRPSFGATVEGPAPLTAPNTVTGALPATGVPALIETVRPARVQAGVSGRLASLASLAPVASYTTNLGADGELGQAVLVLRTRQVTVTVWLPGYDELSDPPTVGERSFDDSFDYSLN